MEGKSREQLLQEWKESRAAKAGGLGSISNRTAQQAPLPGKAPLPRPPTREKENGAQTRPEDAAAGPSVLPPRQQTAGPTQKQTMERQFDALQGRLQALKRDSVRPSITGPLPTFPMGPPAAVPAAPPAPVVQHQQAAPAPLPPAPSLVTSRAREEPPPAAAGGSGFGGIAARLESLKRESLRPSFAGPGAQQVQFEAAGQMDVHSLSKLAVALFEDEGFKGLYEKGMNAQLTRSKDGATEETKIKELAGMVKVLRRTVKELQGKTTSFIEGAVKYEKEAGQQVESVKLSSESAAMGMQAELANARREAATAAAQHKNALASWQGELDMHKAEVARLRREQERVEGERDRAREDCRRVEAGRLALEGEVKEMKKSAGQAVRELQVDKNSTAQALYATREAAERQRAALQEALAAAEARAAELTASNAELAAAAAVAEAARDGTAAQLASLQAGAEALQAELAETRTELSAHRALHEKVVADSACVLGELEEWQEKAAALLAELQRERDAHVATQERADAAGQAAAREQSAWQQERIGLQADKAAAAALERGLSEERCQLKAALTSALAQREGLEAAGQKAAADLAAARQQLEESISAAAALNAQVEGLTARVAELSQALAEEQGERAAAARASSDKEARLARLEGELEALQECTLGLGDGDQREMLGRLVSKVAALEAAVAAAEARRREIHNQLVELRGNIRVFCRMRPSPRTALNCLPDGLGVRIAVDGKEHGFGFDRVFRPETSQAAVFEEVSDLVQSALDGYKVCLFSYGQTGAGKTHTMQGGRSPAEQGIIPRALSKILESVSRLREQGWEYRLEASFIEVYNEALRDLLAEAAPGPRRPEAGRIADSNAIQHAPGGGHTTVAGAARLPVRSEEEAAALVRKAAAARAVEATAMNAVSSRSHSVFMLYITGRHEASGTVLQGSLNLVDLAGSERLGRSQAEGQRQKEACSINKSLSSLGDVFQALAAKAPHVPYRNSKLTHLLQPCLGGSGKTLMFVNINPEPESAGESLCSLRFAAKVNACETAAKGGAQRSVTSMLDTGRLSIAPNDPESRRMSLAGGGIKRKPGSQLPLPRPPARPRLG